MNRVPTRTILAYFTPMLIGITLISLFPIAYNVYVSLTNRSLFHFQHFQFIGLANYRTLFSSLNGDFFIVLTKSFLFVAICIPLFLLFGMLTALAVNHPLTRWKAFWRVALIVPWAVPSYITAFIWKFFFNEQFGTLNQLLRAVFGPHAGLPWLSDPNWAFGSIVIANVWMSYPFFMVVLLGALQSVPTDLLEAAAIDGANAWQRFWRVTLPLLRPAILPAAVLSAILTFQVLNTGYLITEGGPFTSALQPGATEFVMIYAFRQAFQLFRFGYIAAFAVVMFALLFFVTTASLRYTRLVAEEAR
jgi:arabinogalactan oligomer/maltooligosaccharide transport system permease protein